MRQLKFLLGGLCVFIFLIASCEASKFTKTDFVTDITPEVKIIPKPVSLEQQDGAFELTKKARLILLADSLKNSATYLNDYLDQYYGFRLKVVKGTEKDTAAYNAIVLGNQKMEETNSGGYIFKSAGNNIFIKGSDAAGTFYGVQTLIQLLPPDSSQALNIAHVNITDYPRFAYRGMMLDCSRHFFPASFVKKFIDYLALHKLNRFHWHLTDDQGWRIEIEKYPKLTEVGSTRSSDNQDLPYEDQNYSGYYTQEQIREIVKYAQKRYITIIPEIEIPGHSMAAITAYPELTCDSGDFSVRTHGGISRTVLCPTPYTIQFYKNVLDEVMDLFPGQYIHLGGDEAPTDTWDHSDYCQQFMKDHGMTSSREIQGYFSKTFGDYLKAHHRTMIGWDEILDANIPSNAVVMSWRGTSGGIKAAQMQHPVIMAPNQYCYFDMAQTANPDSISASWAGIVTLQKVYSYNPTIGIDSSLTKYILGVQANLWTEVVPFTTKVEYKVFPRMEALAEIAWTPNDEKDFNDFENRRSNAYKRYDLWGVHYYNAD